MSTIPPFDITSASGFSVVLPSGAEFLVLTSDEVNYVKDRVSRYLTDNKFSNVSDLQDIDRMVMFELFVHRWSLWISKGVDYFNDEINERQLSDRVKEFSSEIRQLKKNLGVDKVARDKVRGDDSTVVYLQQLRARAQQFGVMRNEQFNTALQLFHELKAKLEYYDNCDDHERLEGEITQDHIFDWIRTEAIPKFEIIDAEFRENTQKMWIRRQ